MKAGKITTLLLVLITISVSLSAQEKELVVTYKYERMGLRIGWNNNDEITNAPFPPLNVRVYATKEWSIREIDPIVTRKFTRDMQLVSQDTICNYVKVCYSDACLRVPVFGMRDNYTMLLKEPLGLFQWKMEAGNKTILSYTCTKATCTLRGRDYVAYFTREIPFKAAPWKFHGIPGVVLEVYSTDNIVKWEAQFLKVRPRQPHPEIPTPIDEVLSLEQYVKVLQKRKQHEEEIQEQTNLKFPKFEDEHRLWFKTSQLPNSIELFDLD